MCGEMLGYGYPQVVSPCLNILDSIFWSAITTNQSYTRRASFIHNGEHEDFVPGARREGAPADMPLRREPVAAQRNWVKASVVGADSRGSLVVYHYHCGGQ